MDRRIIVTLSACLMHQPACTSPPDCPDGFEPTGQFCLEIVDEDVECREGFELRDGLCYEIVESDVELLLTEDWPACTMTPGDGTLDFSTACAGEICVGMTYDEAVDASGLEANCSESGSFLYCRWPTGVRAYFYDVDQDDVPDAGDEIEELELFAPLTAKTEEGLGLYVELTCWVEVLGAPDKFSLRDVGRGWEAEYLWWERWDLTVWDYLDEQEEVGRDGVSDWMYLGGG